MDIFKKAFPSEGRSFFREWRDSLIFAVTVATLFRWSLASAFVIPTPSMENSLLVGDYLVVSKIHYGPRTPQTPLQIPLTHQTIWGTKIPAYLDWIQLPTWRFPGLQEVKRGEVVVFNVPADLTDPTEYPIDLKTYLVKRCVGVPGDRLELKENQLYVNGVATQNPVDMKHNWLVVASDEIQERHFKRLGMSSNDYAYLGRTEKSEAAYRMSLTSAQAEEFRLLPFIRAVADGKALTGSSGNRLFPSFYTNWSPKDYGPLLIPGEGMTVDMDEAALSTYGEVIREYEGHGEVQIASGKLVIDGKEVTRYTFRQDYFFMMGDNRDTSLDSRYWGFVPEDHVLGKPLFIWMSIDDEADLMHKIRWSRLLRVVE